MTTMAEIGCLGMRMNSFFLDMIGDLQEYILAKYLFGKCKGVVEEASALAL